jgi:hypothetical protein
MPDEPRPGGERVLLRRQDPNGRRGGVDDAESRSPGEPHGEGSRLRKRVDESESVEMPVHGPVEPHEDHRSAGLDGDPLGRHGRGRLGIEAGPDVESDLR